MAEMESNKQSESTRSHWWYDAKEAGVRNPPPTGYSTGRRFSQPVSAELSEVVAAGLPSVRLANIGDQGRRESLKNLVHLCDFATP